MMLLVFCRNNGYDNIWKSMVPPQVPLVNVDLT